LIDAKLEKLEKVRKVKKYTGFHLGFCTATHAWLYNAPPLIFFFLQGTCLFIYAVHSSWCHGEYEMSVPYHVHSLAAVHSYNYTNALYTMVGHYIYLLLAQARKLNHSCTAIT
jgi:hypothetical protein